MDDVRARAILRDELASYRDRTYGELAALVGADAVRVEIRDGETVYQIVIDVVWDSEPHQAVRVLGAIDDGGWRAFVL
ncbi:MAG: hypothetical protein EHM55_04130 [Acidobacteria bacterium]|nr:MAG: hypothetical protein EHM55_04130 [Acidobacteriota bacterium]